MEVKNICCIGAGYVGGPTMAVIALKCPHLNITVVDSNSERIEAWNGPLDQLPIYEPGLSKVVEEARGRNLFFSTDIKNSIEESEMIFMAVNTPTKTKGDGAGMAADLRYIEACARDISKFSKSNKIVIEKSTVPIRTAEKIKEILDQNKKGIHFDILSNPEFLAEGTAVNDMLYPNRVLIGGHNSISGQKAVQALVSIYSNWVLREKILTTNVWSSELSKLASNAMLAQRISSINSLSALCEITGANIDELSDAIGMDDRIGPKFLKASVGFGGSCFQKDILNLVYLCKHFKLEEVAEYWHQVVKINEFQKVRFAQRIIEYFQGNLNGKKIAILGWAFKASTNDSRESSSILVSEILFNEGAELDIYDPMVTSSQIMSDIENYWSIKPKPLKRIQIKDQKFSLNDNYDAMVIITEWEDYKNLNWDKFFKHSNSVVFDGRNIIFSNHKNLISIGK